MLIEYVVKVIIIIIYSFIIPQARDVAKRQLVYRQFNGQ